MTLTAQRRSEEHFAITYHGGAVDGGRMSVQELAPALIALSKSIQEAQQIIEPLGRQPALDISASRDGSFAVDLVLSEGSILQGALDLLAGRETTAVLNLGGLVTIVFGAFALVRRFAGRITKREALEDGTVRITFDDGQSLIVPIESLTIAADRGFREAARDVVAPLRADNMTHVILSADNRPPVRVDRVDLPAFDLPPAAVEQLVDVTQDVALRPVTVAFNEGNKWRVNDGENTFHATILDQPFLDRVSAGEESFSRSDILRARVRTHQWRDTDGELQTERQIVEVLSHIRGSRDVPLPFDD